MDTRGAKAASRQSEEGLRQLLAATGQGIYGVDLQGNCTFVNPACVCVLGYESDQDLLGRNMHALIHHTRPNGEPYRVEECLWDHRTRIAGALLDRQPARPNIRAPQAIAVVGELERETGLEPATFCLGSRHSAN